MRACDDSHEQCHEGGMMRRFLPWAFGALVLAAWEIAVRAAEIPPYVLPGPIAIAEALRASGVELLGALAVTLKVTLAALVFASVFGAGLAFAFAQSPLTERTLFPYAVFMQVTPLVTIAPLVIIWVEDTFTILFILASITAIFPVLSNTLLGLKSVDPNLRAMFKLYGASRWQTFRLLQAPSALPYFMGGLRIACGFALIGAVTAEMVAGTSGAQSGLASRLMEASYRLELPRAMACFVLLSLTGLALYAAFAALSRQLLRHWHESERTGER